MVISRQDGLLPATLVRVNRFGAPARSLLAPWFRLGFRFVEVVGFKSHGFKRAMYNICNIYIYM